MQKGFESRLQLSVLLVITALCCLNSPASHASKEIRSIEFALNRPIKEDPASLLITKIGGEQFERNLLKDNLIFLGNPLDKSRKITAVLYFRENGTPVLNPSIATAQRHCEYTGIPKVTEMHKEFCDSFYGKPIAKSQNTRTYEFVNLNTVDDRSQIEFEFENKHVSKIKVSGLPKHESKWVAVR